MRARTAVVLPLEVRCSTAGCAELGEPALGNTHVGGAQHLDLREGDPALELGEIFGVCGLEQEPLELAAACLILEPLGPGEHLAEGRHVGGTPGECVGGKLLALEQLAVDDAIPRNAAGHGEPRVGEVALGRGEGLAAEGQEIGQLRRLPSTPLPLDPLRGSSPLKGQGNRI